MKQKYNNDALDNKEKYFVNFFNEMEMHLMLWIFKIENILDSRHLLQISLLGAFNLIAGSFMRLFKWYNIVFISAC